LARHKLRAPAILRPSVVVADRNLFCISIKNFSGSKKSPSHLRKALEYLLFNNYLPFSVKTKKKDDNDH
jgi:hypothetical protein